MNDNLEPVRHGENDIADIRPSDKVAMPVHDEDKVKFLDTVKSMIADLKLPEKTQENLDIFFLLFHSEIAERKSVEFLLSQKNMIYTAFHKKFPTVEISQFVQPDHPNYSTFETVFKAFNKSQDAIIKGMTHSTTFYDRACALCIEIESIQADETKNDAVKSFDVNTQLNLLIDLHKGINKEKMDT